MGPCHLRTEKDGINIGTIGSVDPYDPYGKTERDLIKERNANNA
jgi:hypothetical protein